MFIQPDYLSLAIQKLRPGSEYKFIEQDYNSIEWFILNGDAPTQAEIDTAIEAVKIELTQAQAAAQAQKQAILDRLGLTEDELRIVLG